MRGDYAVGTFISLLIHSALFALLIDKSFTTLDDRRPIEVYSITLAGGEKLGGISQVPKKEKETKKAPPKKAQPEKKPQEKPEKQKPKEKTEPKATATPEPETEEEKVALGTPTPEPTTKPTATPKPTKKATPTKAPPKATPKKKATPKPKPKAKPKPKKRELSLAEIDKRLEQSLQRYSGESSDAGGKGFGAARLGGKGTGGGTLRPPEFFQYRSLIERSIKNDWAWHDKSRPLSASVCFSIGVNGDLSQVRLCGESASSYFNDSVVRAVRKASPLPPPPAVVMNFFRDVRIHFSSLE